MKNINTYCLVVYSEAHKYPKCERYMRNMRYLTFDEIADTLSRIFPIQFSKSRSYFVQRNAWGNLSNYEILTLITDEQNFNYIYILGVDRTSNEVIIFDMGMSNSSSSVLNTFAKSGECHSYNNIDQHLYAISMECLKKILFAVIIDAKLTNRLGFEINVLYDERTVLQIERNERGLNLLEIWFSSTILLNRPIQCFINSEKYEVDDILLAEPEDFKAFTDKLVYSCGKDMALLILLYYIERRDSETQSDIITLIKDENIAHVITVIGANQEKDIILYYDSAPETLLVPEQCPSIRQGGFLYENSYAIPKSEFAKIIYAFLLPEE